MKTITIRQQRHELALEILRRLLQRADPHSRDWPFEAKKNPAETFADAFRFRRKPR